MELYLSTVATGFLLGFVLLGALGFFAFVFALVFCDPNKPSNMGDKS